jgi:phenylpropionate dioxygenase-like ring-hydroxylating dioxygenase large terminal subunit
METSGTDQQAKLESLRFAGYRRDPTPQRDLYMTQVERGTPGGEYHRRFWQPIAYLSELSDRPLCARALGEDLVVFRDKSGQIGVLQLHCCHRNASLEFGLIQERGIRCCYHGRVFDVDGTMLEIPGEPDRLKYAMSQGAYPTHTFGGIVFAYMGPMERKPVFPTFDFMDIPDVEIVTGIRLPVDCNWLQMRENTMDPAHTFTLHAIPQWRGMRHFSPQMEVRPEFIFTETPTGMIYSAARRVGENVWIRSAESLGPNLRRITSIFEEAAQCKSASPPFLTFWTLPVDDSHSITFFISHVARDEPMPFEKRRALEVFGQYNDRPYEERQWIPGDYDAQVSQGPTSSTKEHLGSQDRGVVLFRRYIRRNIEAVERGDDPHGVYLSDPGILPSYANDRVVPVSAVDGDPNDPKALAAFAELTAQDYLANPPMRVLRERPAVGAT